MMATNSQIIDEVLEDYQRTNDTLTKTVIELTLECDGLKAKCKRLATLNAVYLNTLLEIEPVVPHPEWPRVDWVLKLPRLEPEE